MIKGKKLNYEYSSHDENGELIYTTVAVKDVDINIKKGEFISVLGHNGSGKSTLAKLFNVLLKPKSGELFVNGLDVYDENNLWEIRQSAGMVFQNPDNQLIASIVEDDVAFGPENLGIEPKKILDRVLSALSLTKMTKYRNRSTNKLSGGQKQRVGIAGVLAMNSKCIILDEPTAMLDPKGRKDIIEGIKKLNREGITIILITHYMEEAIESDRIFVMERGEIKNIGTPRQIFKDVELMKSLRLDVPLSTEIAHFLKTEGVDIDDDVLNSNELVEAICQLK